MDSLSRLVAALVAGAANATDKGGNAPAQKLYAKLKRQLAKNARAQEAIAALKMVEQKPDSEARRGVLREELVACGAEEDAGLVELVETLVDVLPMAAQGAGPAAVVAQTGSGAVASGAGAMAVGAHGVLIAGNFKGNIFHGAAPTDDAQILAVYRQCVANSCAYLPLRGVDVGASDPTASQKQLDLDRVYVDLDTTSVSKTTKEKKGQRRGLEIESRPASALYMASHLRRLVILGAPGSGKSTFLNHLSFCLARHGLEPQGKWLTHLKEWPAQEGALVPITVVLRDFARSLSVPLPKATPHLLWDFVTAQLAKQNLGFAAGALLKALDEGRALVLLDGLDEVATEAQRALVRDAVAVFAARHTQSRMIVSCRTLSYEDARWRLPEKAFPHVTLAPFSAEKIAQFITAWFADLAEIGSVKAEDAARLAGQLQTAVRRNDLRELAANPLLLTVMALVHAHKGELPDARAQLYDEAVELLLWRWELVKTGGEATRDLRTLLREAGRTDVDLKRVLWRLAYEAHEKGGSAPGVADIGELALQNALSELHPSRSLDWTHEVIRAINQRAGLLLERQPQVYGFPHRTFQEHLAGAHLASQPAFVETTLRLVAAGAFWREVVLLAVGKLTYVNGETEKALGVAGGLCPEAVEPGDAWWRNVWLAGEVLREIGVVRVGDHVLGKALLPRVQQRLAELVGGGALSPVERAAAGVALGRIGDRRKGVGVGPDGGPDIAWIALPAGAFPMGNDKPAAKYDDEQPRFLCTLIKQPYTISRYPVTFAQYRAFEAEGGYEKEKYWTKAGWAWRERAGVTGPDNDRPEVYQTPNHPRVGVSWYEAMAFCGWLAEKTGRLISLPSEAQWERAARHTDGRVYPWGDAEECARRCNMSDTGIGHTTAVGLFPAGGATGGATDMAGNVWEWCRTEWRDNYENYQKLVSDEREGEGARVLRGGAFNLVSADVRCAVRNGSHPVGRYHFIGFRVVASPFSEL